MGDETSTANTGCRVCGKALGPADPTPYCAACSVEAAERAMEEEGSSVAGPATAVEREEQRRERGALTKRVVMILLIIISIGVIAARIPAVASSLSPEPPVRDGSAKTDASGDACINNLWLAEAALTEGREPGPELVCPASQQSYLLTRDAGGARVACPNPDRHGLSELYVTTQDRVPVAR